MQAACMRWQAGLILTPTLSKTLILTKRTVAAPLSANPNPDPNPNPNPNPNQGYRGCAAQCHAEQEAGVEGVGVEGAGHGRRG